MLVQDKDMKKLGSFDYIKYIPTHSIWRLIRGSTKHEPNNKKLKPRVGLEIW
jgi:hypothetical protein